MITNILSNAVKYSPEGSEIKIKLRENKGYAEISIEDQGIGIKKSDQKKIFEAYGSLEKDKYKKGLGLGLYICMEIISLHQGKIWVESEVNKGSTFFITLPIK